MSTLILIAVLLGFNPANCKAGPLNQLYEDNSFTTYESSAQVITCQRIYDEPKLGYTLVRTASIWLFTDGYKEYGYMYFEGQPFPESVSTYFGSGEVPQQPQ